MTDPNKLIMRSRYAAAERAARDGLRQIPDGEHVRHWWLAQLSSALYEQRRYAEALEAAESALRIAPRCPDALWHYAGALWMLDRDDEAATVYRRLLRRGVRGLTRGPCSEGKRSAGKLLTACRERIGAP